MDPREHGASTLNDSDSSSISSCSSDEKDIELPHFASVVTKTKTHETTGSRIRPIASRTEEFQSIQEAERAIESEAEQEAYPDRHGREPNLVDWDGPDDPQNPQNWPRWRKWMTTM